MWISVAAVQCVSTELQQAHGKKPVKILLPPRKLSQHDRNRQHVEHVHRDYLPPEDKFGDLQPLTNLVHHGSGEEVRDGVNNPMNSRKPEFLAKAINDRCRIGGHKHSNGKIISDAKNGSELPPWPVQ